MALSRRQLIAAAGAFVAMPAALRAQGGVIKIGVPLPLSGPAALYGEPALKGIEMFVSEINASGGVLGRKIEILARDSKASADEAVRAARELILKENVNFLVGTMTSAEGPAVSAIAKEEKIVLIAAIPKTDQLTAPNNLHPYVFRTAANTTIEGRSSAQIMARWSDVKRIATIAHNYAYGQDVVKAFIDQIKKLRPDIEIVDQQWPKLGEADYTPFINAQLARKPDAIFSGIWGGYFVTWVKQARPLGLFESVNYRIVNAGEVGAIEVTRALGAEYPFGIYANSYDLASYDGQPEAHRKFVERLKAFTKQDPPSTWPIITYVAMQFLIEAIRKANSIEGAAVSQALLGLSIDAPFGKQVLRARDHQADRGQFYGKMIKDPGGAPFALMSDVKYLDPKPFMD